VKKLFCTRQIFFSLFLLVLPGALLAQVPKSNHVVVVLEENHGYSSVIGNTAMPYLNSLATKNALATQYYANTHPSIGNYLEMTTGQIITNNDGFSGTISADNIVRHLLTAGKTWKSYAEGLPSIGYTGGDTGSYVRHHNPFTYFSDVLNSSVEKLNLVPFTQFANDLNNNQLPNFSFVVPNLNDDAHNGTLAQADGWLQTHIAPLLNNAAFQQDGILIILFDEALTSDATHGGGHVAFVMVGPGVKKGFKSTALYQHQNLLRTVMDAIGVHSYPGAAATAGDMSDMFTGSSPTPTPTPSPTPSPTPAPSGCIASTVGVTLCAPISGSTSASPVRFYAAAKSTHPITAMRIYIDGVSAYVTSVASLDVSLAVSSGTHAAVVQAWDSSGTVFKASITLQVSSGGVPAGCVASTTGVKVCSPAAGATIGSPVHVTAAAKSAAPITAMRIYVDSVSQYLVNASTIDTSLSIASGTHSLVVQAWDSSGVVLKTPLTIHVQ
jgi:phosphatidylinositol-3-phosphatase